VSTFACADPGCPYCESACETCGRSARRNARWTCDHCGLQAPCDGGQGSPPYHLIPEGWGPATSALYEFDACSLECFMALIRQVPDEPVLWEQVTEAD
jgi:hypothetical protein